MFKDVYKRANDSIDTQDAYKRLMEKIESPVKRKNPNRHAYKAAAAMAACLVIAVSTGVYVHISENIKTESIAKIPEKNPNRSENELAKRNDTAADEQNLTEETAEIAKEPAITVKPQEKAAAVKLPEKKAAQAKEKTAEPQPLQTNLPEEKAADTPIPTVAPKERAQKLDININEPLYEAKAYSGDAEMKKSADMGAANAMFAITEEDALRQKETTLDEYYNYLGKDVKKSLTLPQGFADKTADTQMLCVDADGNYSFDNWIFMYVCEDKRIEITTTKNTGEVKDIINGGSYKKSSVYGIDTVVVKNGDGFTAYMIKDNVAYTANCRGITLADLQNLLVSIAQ